MPKTIDTERCNEEEEEIKIDEKKAQGGSSDLGGLSTRGCEISHSENSGVETLA